jgi:type II secretion system protein J
LQREIRYIVPRPIRDKYNTQLPAVKLEGSGDIIFSFTRAGIPNPTGVQKNSLQRIDYLFTKQLLKKRTWLSIDNNNSEDYREEIISEKLTQFKIEILGFNNNWYQQWPSQKNDPLDLMPKAVKVTLVSAETGEIVRLLELPL